MERYLRDALAIVDEEGFTIARRRKNRKHHVLYLTAPDGTSHTGTLASSTRNRVSLTKWRSILRRMKRQPSAAPA